MYVIGLFILLLSTPLAIAMLYPSKAAERSAEKSRRRRVFVGIGLGILVLGLVYMGYSLVIAVNALGGPQ